MMDEERLRRVLSEMLKPIEERLDRVESKVDKNIEMTRNIQSQLNTVEHRVVDLTDQHKLGIRQTSAEIGELRHNINHIKSKVGLEVF